jgi:hypothetical protein
MKKRSEIYGKGSLFWGNHVEAVASWLFAVCASKFV